MPLRDRNILLGVTGSIAAYKTPEIIRLLQKNGAHVRVVMSGAAERFVTVDTIETLCRFPALNIANESWTSACNHIDLARWADVFLIAPATANSLNKLAAGIADTLPLQCALAYDKPILLAPAANVRMLENPATQASLNLLQQQHVLITPRHDRLACGEEGAGAMEEPAEIIHHVIRALATDSFWHDRTVLISGGGTKERIDSVRFIGNDSSGTMARALALNAYHLGANPVCVTTIPLQLPKAITQVIVSSAEEMHTALHDAIQKHAPTHYFSAAAIGDYRSESPRAGKLKKSEHPTLTLQLIQNPDILESLKSIPLKKIGFKLEEEWGQGKIAAQKALNQKSLDAIALNVLAEQPLGSDTGSLCLLTKEREIWFEKQSKETLALALLKAVETL